MDSSDLGNFTQWQAFNAGEIVLAPQSKGVYAIRKAGGTKFGRLVGESDILYIGCTDESVGGLRRRLRGYVNPGRTQWTNKRVKKIISKHPAEIAWCVTNSPKSLECTLLQRYLADHDELPPLNNSEERTLESDLPSSFSLRKAK